MIMGPETASQPVLDGGEEERRQKTVSWRGNQRFPWKVGVLGANFGHKSYIDLG